MIMDKRYCRKKNEHNTFFKSKFGFFIGSLLSRHILYENYKLLRNIKSNKIDIKDNNWQIYDFKILNLLGKDVEVLEFYSNFNQKVIETLFSNLFHINSKII